MKGQSEKWSLAEEIQITKLLGLAQRMDVVEAAFDCEFLELRSRFKALVETNLAANDHQAAVEQLLEKLERAAVALESREVGGTSSAGLNL